MTNIVKAVFGSSKFATTRPLWKYDHGMILKFVGVPLPSAYEVHFSNDESGTAKTKLGGADGVEILDEYFLTGKDIYAWVYIDDGDSGYTEYRVKIPVLTKAQPTDQEPTPVQQTIIEEAISALNDAAEGIPTAIDTALAEAKASGEFDGPPGEQGPQGVAGEPGEDGYSPMVTVEEIPGGHRVTITDAEGEHSFDVMDGSGSGGASVYWAVYNETTPAIIKFLTDSGNAVLCSYSGRVYNLAKASATAALFISIEENNVYWLSASTSMASTTWSNGVLTNYVKPTGGIPKTDLASTVQDSLDSANSAYQKPANGIPASDLASGVIPTVPVASDDTPQALGTAAAGSSAKFSRADHVHTKPTYSKSDVGLGNVDNVQQYSANNPPPYPVTSVNGNTGAVTLSIPSTAGDVGAIAAPSSPVTGAFLVYNGSAWVAQTLSTWQGGNY